MRYLRNILAVIVVLFWVLSCHKNDAPVLSGRLIRFAPDAEWPGLTKTVITDLDGIEATGFRVWGQWHQDPDNGDYNNYDDIVFGESGMKMTYGQNAWTGDDEKEWQRGYYAFAAVLYPDDFSGTLTSSFNKTTVKDPDTSQKSVTLSYSNLLSVDLPDDGLSLACTDATKGNQIDFMYAFNNQDNSADQASDVNLHFNHLFSLLNLKLSVTEGTFKSNSILVKKVSLYGIHNTISGKLNIMQTITTDAPSDATVTNSLRELLLEADVSTKINPFYSAQFDGTLYDADKFDLVENLLVFPEMLSEQISLKVLFELQCVDQANPWTKEFYTEINTGQWKSGVPYTYLIPIDLSKL